MVTIAAVHTSRPVTKNAIFEFINDRALLQKSDTNLSELVKYFHVEPVTKLREILKNKLPRTQEDIDKYSRTATNLYQQDASPPRFFNLLHLLLKAHLQGELYITSDGHSIIPTNFQNKV